MKISNFTDIFKTIQTKFPIEECIEKDKKEEAIYNSKNKYICMIIDKRFKNNIELKIMTPYIWVGNESRYSGHEDFKDFVGYGWIDENGHYIDNFENPIHVVDDEIVIGFVPYEDKNSDDLKLWDIVKEMNYEN